MSPGRPRHGVVTLASLDVRRRPGHVFELRSQLLVGEVVDVLGISRDGLWWRVRSRTDRYIGWVRSWGVVGTTAARAALWEKRATARVTAPYAAATARPGGGAGVSPLFFNGRVVPGSRKGRHRQVELPDGRRGWVIALALEVGRRRPPALVERVESLLGIPYLWGGRTPLGYDCSGFTQQVLAEQGIPIPRDAALQHRVGRPLARGEADRTGDLVFFGALRGPAAHVGIGLGQGYFAHARGRVRISSTEPSNPLYDNDLNGSLRGWRRPSEGRSRWAASPVRRLKSA
jgi:hypothetical protein